MNSINLLFLRRHFEGIKTGATAEGFVKGVAEMAQAGITDFQGGFGNVELSGLKQFRRAFHAELAQVLRNGHARGP